MNYYPRHIGDFVSATVGLSLAERGAYSALLDRYYADEQPLPLEKRECYRAAGASTAAERKAVDYVLGRFFSSESDGYHNKRADKEILAHHDKSAKASESAQARWGPRNADAMRTHSEGNASQEPIANSQKPVEQRGADAPAPRKRATRLPDDWQLPSEWSEWAMGERGWSAGEVLRVSLLFRDHWRSKGEARADWPATWRNWVRRERSVASQGSRPPTLAEKRAANIALLTGQVKREREIFAERVGGATVSALPSPVRESDGDDVGGRPNGRSEAGMG